MYIAESAYVFPGELTSSPTDLMPIPDHIMMASLSNDSDSDEAMDGDQASKGYYILSYMSIIPLLYIDYISGMKLLSDGHQPEAPETD